MMARGDSCSGTDRVDKCYTALAVTGSIDPSDPPGGGEPDPRPAAAASDQAVVAAMGPQGVLRLDPASGEWERIAVGPCQPISTFGPTWLLGLIFVPLVSIVATPLLLVIGRVRHVSGNRQAIAGIVNIVGSLGVFVLMVTTLLITFGRADYAIVGLASLGLSIVGFLVAAAIVMPAGSPTAAHPAPPPPLR